MRKLEHTVAIVTGASKGIGAAIARRLAAEGAAVVVNCASSKDAADRVVAQIDGAGGRARAVQADVSRHDELGPRNIRVNAVNLGMVETEGVREAGLVESGFRKQVEAQTPLGRIGQPDDIAPAVVFLASRDAAWIIGETLLVAGGLR